MVTTWGGVMQDQQLCVLGSDVVWGNDNVSLIISAECPLLSVAVRYDQWDALL
jgi:hypothetical protein